MIIKEKLSHFEMHVIHLPKWPSIFMCATLSGLLLSMQIYKLVFLDIRQLNNVQSDVIMITCNQIYEVSYSLPL